jgi:hypothetical protein
MSCALVGLTASCDCIQIIHPPYWRCLSQDGLYASGIPHSDGAQGVKGIDPCSCRPADRILHIACASPAVRLLSKGTRQPILASSIPGLTDRTLGASRLGPFPAALERLRRRFVALAAIDTVASISRACLRTDVTTQALLQSCALQALACLVALVRDVPCALRILGLCALGARHEQSARQRDCARADKQVQQRSPRLLEVSGATIPTLAKML